MKSSSLEYLDRLLNISQIKICYSVHYQDLAVDELLQKKIQSFGPKYLNSYPTRFQQV